jgi:hypothetical protein
MPNGLVFVHIPKAAGTSLREVVARHYPRDVQLATEAPIILSDEQRRRIRVLVGHVPFGTQAQLAPPVDVITMLRDPIDRVISLYYFIRRLPHHPLHGAARRQSLEDFAASRPLEACNQQVRQIGGVDPPSLDAALGNLMRGVRVFGIAERFDESLVLMQRAVGWRNIYHRDLNVTRDRPRLRDVSPVAVRRIERENALDLELYARARLAFAAIVDRQDDSFVEAVRRLRRFNPAYSALSRALHAAARVMPGPVRRAVREVLTAVRR